MTCPVAEAAYATIQKEFEIDDQLGVRWRTKQGITWGLAPAEAYKLALAFAGLDYEEREWAQP